MTPTVRRTSFGILVVGRFPLSQGAAELLSRLHPDEVTLARPWAERRQRTFAMGRLMARAALVVVGADLAGPILKDDRGAPLVPAPWSLSLSHKDEVAAALLATEEHAHIGVDLEPLAERAHARDIAAHVLTERERAELTALDEDERRRQVLVRFALKEALYKALDPFVRRYVGFLEAEARPAASPVVGSQPQERDAAPGGEPAADLADEREAELSLALPAHEGPFVARGRLLVIDELAVAMARVARAHQPPAPS